MKKLLLAAVLCSALWACASEPSYWWSQMLVKPDAAQSQAFFFWPGTNVLFTYASNHVIINSKGGGGTNTGTNCFTYSASPLGVLLVSATGTGCSNIEYSLTGNLLSWSGMTTAGYTNGLLGAGSIGTAAYSNASAFYLSSNPSHFAPSNTLGSAAWASSNDFQHSSVNLSNWASLPTNIFYPSNNPAGFAPSNTLGSAAFSNSTAFYPASNPSNFIWAITNYLLPGANITFSTNGSGVITITATGGGGGGVSLAGTNVWTGTNTFTLITVFSNIVYIAAPANSNFFGGVVVVNSGGNSNYLGGVTVVASLSGSAPGITNVPATAITNAPWNTNRYAAGTNITIYTNAGTVFVAGTVTGGASGPDVTAWHTNGNGIPDDGIAFIGTTNKANVIIKANGLQVGKFYTNQAVRLGQPAASDSIGAGAVVVGNNSQATSGGALAIGSACSAGTAAGATAIGFQCSAQGQGAVAIGYGSSVIANYGLAIGHFSGASGISSVALGESATTDSDYSVAMGYAAEAVNIGSFVWSDSNADGLTDSAENQYVITADNGFHLNLGVDGGSGDITINGLTGMTTNITVLTTLPSTFKTLHFTDGILTSITP